MSENHRIITRGEIPKGRYQADCHLCYTAIFEGELHCSGCRAIIQRTKLPIPYLDEDKETLRHSNHGLNRLLEDKARIIQNERKLNEVLRHEIELMHAACRDCGVIPTCLCARR